MPPADHRLVVERRSDGRFSQFPAGGTSFCACGAQRAVRAPCHSRAVTSPMAVALVIIAGLIFVARLTYWATRIRQDAKDTAAAEAWQQGASA